MKIRKLFFLAIIAVLLGVVTTCEDTDSPTNRQGDTENKYGPAYTVPGGTLTAKLQWLESNAVSNTNYIIEVANDEFINPQSLYFSGRSNITIQLKGIGGEKVIQNNATKESLFTIRNNVTLILKENIVLNGSSYSILVSEGGGTFIMEGGKIDRVRVDGGTFTMIGGEISDHVRVYGGTFTMNGGKIDRVSVYGGTSTMNGGESGGVLVEGTFTMNGGTISNEYESVRVRGTFTMNGGTITGITTAFSYGVVLVEEGGTFTMNGGEISGNTSGIYVGGGGVLVEGGTFNMTGGEISGNTFYGNGYGGGVCIIAISSSSSNYYNTNYNTNFRKTGGIITGYSSDHINGNVVKDYDDEIQNGRGHAIYAEVNGGYDEYGNRSSSFIRFKDTTVGEQDNLSYVSNGQNPPTISGAWDELDE